MDDVQRDARRRAYPRTAPRRRVDLLRVVSPTRRRFLRSLLAGAAVPVGPREAPDEIKRIAGAATDVARASAVAKKRDVQLAPVPAYDEFWQVPIEKDPWDIPLEEKAEHLRTVNTRMQKNPAVLFAVATMS